MIVDPYAKICRHPFGNLLVVVDIAGDFVLIVVFYEVFFVAAEEIVPSFAAEVLIVESNCYARTAERTKVLIDSGSCDKVVVHVEVVFFGLIPQVSVVDFVMSPVVEETDAARCVAVIIGGRDTCKSSENVGLGVKQWSVFWSRIVEVEIGEVEVGRYLPMVRYLISNFYKVGNLLETRIIAVTVGALVVCAKHCREFAILYACHSLQLCCAVASAREHKFSLDAVFRLAGNDVDHSAHSVRAVKQRRRSAEHLHLVGHECLVCVGDWVTHQSCILRLTVDKHQYS